LLEGQEVAEAIRQRDAFPVVAEEPTLEAPATPSSPAVGSIAPRIGDSETEAADPKVEVCPLHVVGEVVNNYKEGRSFALGRQDRIVCGVETPEGRHTRYLVLHPFLLLLVQPDLVSPGWAAVRTLAPVRQVESYVDRTDQRTLRLGIRLPRGASCPGEAACYDPAKSELGFSPEEHRGGSFFMLTLSFEDVKRCHCADHHVKKRRQEVRAQVRQKVEAFIEGLIS